MSGHLIEPKTGRTGCRRQRPSRQQRATQRQARKDNPHRNLRDQVSSDAAMRRDDIAAQTRCVYSI